MLKELKRVQINVQKQKLQQKCIDKEKKCVKETLKKLKDTGKFFYFYYLKSNVKIYNLI